MKAKILVVEDEGLVADDLRERLIRLGYDCCETVDNGTDALKAAQELRPDLILMDIRIRGPLDGIQVASQLRANLQSAVVFLTAHADSATLARAQVTEPFGYVLKPFNDRELQINIELALFRHQAESRQRKMERWLATTLDSIGDGVITTDLNTRVTFMNPVAEMITGWRQREAIGKDFNEVFTLLNEDTLQPCGELLGQALSKGVTIHLDERYCLRHRQGQLVPVDDSMAPIREGEEISGAVVVFRDRTMRKMAQEEKHKLEARIQETQKLESLGLLAAGVAHDFNNLLGIISGNLAICREDDASPELVAESLQEIELAADRAAQLCGQMLAHAGRGKSMNVEVDISALVQSTFSLLRTFISSAVSIDLALASDILPVLGDPRQLQQIILNLVINAAEAVGERAGQISIKTSQRWSTETELQTCRLTPGMRAGQYVVLEVSDNGSGMDAATQSRLFDAFFTTKFQGRGLGLAATAGVIRAHQACVRVDSELSKGTTFRILFPAVAQKSASLRPSCVAPPEGLKQRFAGLALVVDDEPAMRVVVSKMMQSFGFQVITARDGREAVQEVANRGEGIRIIVMDLTMPNVSGREALSRIHETQPDIPVVVMSGYEVSQHKDGPPEFPHFLHKPFSIADLRNQVSSLFQLAHRS